MPQANKSPRALRDLASLWDYIAADNSTAADKFADEIERVCALIATMPGVGRPYEDLAPLLRGFPIGRYMIFYRPSPSGIEVVRVLHAGRNIHRGFFHRTK